MGAWYGEAYAFVCVAVVYGGAYEGVYDGWYEGTEKEAVTGGGVYDEA